MNSLRRFNCGKKGHTGTHKENVQHNAHDQSTLRAQLQPFRAITQSGAIPFATCNDNDLTTIFGAYLFKPLRTHLDISILSPTSTIRCQQPYAW